MSKRIYGVRIPKREWYFHQADYSHCEPKVSQEACGQYWYYDYAHNQYPLTETGEIIEVNIDGRPGRAVVLEGHPGGYEICVPIAKEKND